MSAYPPPPGWTDAPRHYPPSAPPSGDIDLTDAMDRLSRGRYLLLLLLLTSFFGALLWGLWTPPVYPIRAMVQVSSGAMDGGEQVQTAAEITTLRSWRLMQQVLEDWPIVEMHPADGWYPGNLSFDLEQLFPGSAEAYRTAEIDIARFDFPPSLQDRTLILHSDGEGAYRLLWPDGTVLLRGEVGQSVKAALSGNGDLIVEMREFNAAPGLRWEITPRSRQEFSRRLLQRMETTRKDTDAPDVMAVTFDSTVPDPDRRFLTRLLERYLEETLSRRTLGIDKAIAYLDKSMLDNREQLVQAEQRLRDLQQQEGFLNLSQSAQFLLDEMVKRQSELAKLHMKFEENNVLYTDRHPDQIALQQQLKLLETEVKQIEQQLEKLPEVQFQTVQLMRQIEVLNELYRYNEDQSNRLRLDAARIRNFASILEFPLLDPLPTAPRVGLVLGVSLLVTLLLGVLLVLLRESTLLARARDIHRLRRQLDTPILALVHDSPEARKDTRKSVHVLANRESHTYRAVSGIAASVEFLTRSASNPVIALTSDGRGTGKSFIALNFAAICASRQRVLLVDANLQDPALDQVFQIDRRPGLSGVIIGKHDAREAIREVVSGKLWVLPAGQTPPNTEVLLAHPRFHQIMQELVGEFDVIIVDYPAQDAADVRPEDFAFAGTVVLVAGYGQPVLRLKRFIQRFRELGGRRVEGIILNRVPDPSGIKLPLFSLA